MKDIIRLIACTFNMNTQKSVVHDSCWKRRIVRYTNHAVETIHVFLCPFIHTYLLRNVNIIICLLLP